MTGLGHALPALLKLGVELADAIHEVGGSAFEVFLWNEGLDVHILLIDAFSRLSDKDDELSEHIFAAEVDAWVRLAYLQLLCLADNGAQRSVGRKVVEDVVERAAEHSLYFDDAVAAGAEVVNGFYDGKACADVCLVEKFHAVAQGRVLEGGVGVVRR